MHQNKIHLIRFYNVLLRAIAMGSRFILVFGLAYFLDPGKLGEYGLIVASLGFSVLIIGGDYFTYSHRELMSSKKERWSFIFQHNTIALLMLYLILLPLQLGYFYYGLLSWSLIGWFFTLLIIEHLALEMNRLLIVMREPLLSSFVLLIRAGVWVWALLPWMWFDPSSRNLDEVFFFWSMGGASAVLFALWIIKKKVRIWMWSGIDWGWIRKGFGVGGLFLISTLSFKALTTVDRYFVEYFMNTELLAVYVVYIGMAMSIYSFVDSAVTSFLYPRAVSAWRTSEFDEFYKVMRELWVTSIMCSVSLAFIVGISAPWILGLVGKEIYLEHLDMLWVLLLAAIVYSIGLVPHYGLYSKGGDKEIMAIHLSSLLVFFGSIGVMAKLWVEGAVAVGLLLSFCWVGGAKLMIYRGIKSVI
mgnify:CR=1 FL=1